MTYHSKDFFPQTMPTGWNQRSQSNMPNYKYRQQVIRRAAK